MSLRFIITSLVFLILIRTIRKLIERRMNKPEPEIEEADFEIIDEDEETT